MDFDVAKFIAKVEEFANKEVAREGKTDGQLDEYEKNSLFTNKELTQELANAIKNGEITEIDANEIFGLSKTDFAKYKQSKADVTKTSRQMMQDDVLDRILKGGSSYFLTNDKSGNIVIADDVDWNTFTEDIKNRLIGDNVQSVNKEYYTKLVEQVTSVADTVKKVIEEAKKERTDGQAYDSRDDVMKLYDKISKELNISNKDEFADFKTSVLDNFMFVVEKHQMAKEETRVTTAYKDFRKSGMTREQAVKAVKTAKNEDGSLKFKDSYYESFGNKFGSIGKSISHKGLLKDMENGIVMEDARQEVMDAIWAQRGKDITKSGDVEEAAKQELGENNDKYTAKIFRGELTFSEKVKWERSTIKDFRKAVAAYNRVEANKKKEFTEKQMTDVFKDDKVFSQLVNDGQLITKNDNNTYNISNLSDLIRDAISYADYRANYQTKDNSTLGEIESVMRAVRIKTGVGISRADAKNLIDFCGFDRDKKNVLLTIYNGAIGGLASTVASGVTALLVTAQNGSLRSSVDIDTSLVNSKLKNTEFPMVNILHNPLDVDITISSKTIIDGVEVAGTTTVNRFDIMYQLSQEGFLPGEYGFDKLEDGSYRLWIKRAGDVVDEKTARLVDILGENFEINPDDIEYKEHIEQDDPNVKRDKAFLIGMLVGLALSILNEALKELPGEKAVLTTDFQSKTIEEYEEELKDEKNLPAQAQKSIKQIAEYYYKKDGNLDGYHEFLRKAAGGSSVLNKKELLNALYMKLVEIKAELNSQPVEKAPEPVEQKKIDNVVIPKPEPKPEPDLWALNEDSHINVKRTGWAELRKMYDDSFPKEQVLIDGKKRDLSTRMLKVMQGMQETKLTVEQIRTLAEMSFSIPVKRLPTGELDAKDFEAKAREKFKDVKFLEKYDFNYTQFALSICSIMPGDDKNELIAPEILYHDDGTICERGYNPADMTFTGGGKVGFRGEVGNTYEGATRVNGEVNTKATRAEVNEVRQRVGEEGRDQNLLKKKKTE